MLNYKFTLKRKGILNKKNKLLLKIFKSMPLISYVRIIPSFIINGKVADQATNNGALAAAVSRLTNWPDYKISIIRQSLRHISRLGPYYNVFNARLWR